MSRVVVIVEVVGAVVLMADAVVVFTMYNVRRKEAKHIVCVLG